MSKEAEKTMKVAIISFGHVDSILPLSKYLSRSIDVDLYLMFAQTRKFESIVNFTDITVDDGFLREKDVNKILGKEILGYIGDRFSVSVYIYESLKIHSMRNIFSCRRVAKRINEGSYDLIHFNGNHFFQVYVSAFLKQLPKIHTIHDFEGHIEKKTSWGQKLRLPERLNHHLAKRDRFKIVHAKRIQEYIYKTIPSAKKIKTVYYGPLEIYSSFQTQQSIISVPFRYILFFGRIAEYKGIPYLIAAFERIQEEISDLHLVIAGSGDIDFFSEEASCNPRIMIINRYIQPSELAELIDQALFIVCPYLDASQSGVVQTAYAFAKPVIATDVGGLAEIVESGRTGFLVPTFDSYRLAEAIKHLVRDERKRQAMMENIRIRLKKEFQWEYIAEQTLSIYRDAVRNHP